MNKIGRPKSKLERRIMVRCSESQFERWQREARRRGLDRGNDTGVGALLRLGGDSLIGGES